MYRPPRPRTTVAGSCQQAAGMTSPIHQVPLGFLDPEANQFEGAAKGGGGGMWRRPVLSDPGMERLSLEEVAADDMTPGAMKSGSYFTDLMYNGLNGFQESQDVPPIFSTQEDVTPATTKGSQGRSNNFRVEEDILLVSAWLNVGMDPIRGVDQACVAYWTRIYDYFHKYKTFNSDRTQVSLMNRWGSIQHDVNFFCGCLSRIEDSNHSGWTVDDKIAIACTLFKSEEKKQKKFAYMHCWKNFNDKPKWLERNREHGTTKKGSNKRQKTVVNSFSCPTPSATVVDGAGVAEPRTTSEGRPDGKKKEKQNLRQHSTIEALDHLVDKMKEADDAKQKKELKKEETCNRAFALQEEKIRLEKEKFEFERGMEEERILCLDLSTMNSKQQQYYEGRQNEILARRNGC